MSASEFRIPYQQVSSSQPSENAGQFKICRCGEGDPNETADGTPTSCPNCQNVPPPRGAEPIVTLGGIDLNNSGSVVVKEERKLLTVLFPDGRDGRIFTLKAETTEDLNEWRSALENALAQAPSVATTVGQNPIFSTDVAEPAEAAVEQSEDYSVVGKPAEFALVDPDGSPSFMEKALTFIEDYGKNEFSPEEDAHVIGDCIKVFGNIFFEKCHHLQFLQHVVLPWLQLTIVESHKAVNRMSQSALAACMAPLLLRPLLLGECEIDNDFSMGGDGSFQLLQAAAAANHAQAIVIVMLEEYDQIFADLEEGSSEAYTESEDDKEYSTDNDIHDEDGSYDSGEDDIEEELDDNSEHSSGGSEYEKVKNSITGKENGASRKDTDQVSSVQLDSFFTKDAEAEDDSQTEINNRSEPKHESRESNESNNQIVKSNSRSSALGAKSIEKSSSSTNKGKRTLWGRTSARKDLSTEEIECCSDDETLVDKLENNKADLQSKIKKEVKENGILQVSLERRKEELHERRLALAKEVENLRDQLQKERSLRASLESGLMNMRRGQVSLPSTIDSKESGNAPAANALAKLTNRLNFLKERRALLASEMQGLDLSRPQQGQSQGGAGAAAVAAAAAALVPPRTRRDPR
ncbi:hypothetical protein PR202_gb18221 [Eleusine coracana subsp. coracana]|uniref:PH domain-containing protein n=1 Tax=Eleusine coracana subsp. coracana TaxID=191504 RepID=A0AAV5F2S2_ELECO|nr:hypothetical protein PR202_gb18221 [Eleusine coracana subsp. coracana]